MNAQIANESINQVEKVTQTLMQACEEASATAREHMDATLRSANVAWEGCSEINQNMSNLIQESLSRAMNAGKTIASARSLQEAIELQTDFVKQAIDSWMNGTGRISQISARVTKEAFDLITEHANNTFGKMAQRVKAA